MVRRAQVVLRWPVARWRTRDSCLDNGRLVDREARVDGKSKIRIEQHGGMGLLWFGAWLFTLGYLKLAFWRGVLALLLWPYYLGEHFAAPQP